MSAPTQQQVLSLAPDENSVKAARELANPKRWKNLGAYQLAVWGECQGSGAIPYMARVDLSDCGAKCSCPSRKLPCKHALGLLLLYSKTSDIFIQAEPPEWVTEWIVERHQRQEKKKQREESGQPPDPVAQAKRAAERSNKITAGLADLDRWLQDLIRRGFAGIQHESYAFWEAQSKRLVDAQAPGLARLVRHCAGTASIGQGWEEKLLRQIAQLHLLLEGYSRVDTLPQEVQSDLRTIIGFTSSQEEILSQDGVLDRWIVIGQKTEEDERLRSQRTWLLGQSSGRTAIILSFAYGNALLDTSLLAGQIAEAEIVFYPSAYPQRALLKRKISHSNLSSDFSGYQTFELALSGYAEALAKNPWLDRFPMALNNVLPIIREGNEIALLDSENNVIPLAVYDAMLGWRMAAASGGSPISIFGEWNGRRLLPWSMFADGSFNRL